MKSITTSIDIPRRQEGSKVTSIISNMFGGGGGSKRVLAEAEEENNSKSMTTVSDTIIALDKNYKKKNSFTASSGSKFLSRVFNKKKFLIDGAMKTSRLSLLRRIVSAKRRAAKREEEEGGNDLVVAADELCKRRILMGMKCKPVNASGKLHYGQDGVILHEE